MSTTAQTAGTPLLQISDLSVYIGQQPTGVAALSTVTLEVHRGEIVGLVGESGGGKSMTARSVIGMLPRTATVTGSVNLDGVNVLTMGRDELRRHRGKGAAMCFQNPTSALLPTRTVGRQIVDRLIAHQGMGRKEARSRAVQLLGEVGIRDPQRRFSAYAHEMSGGMCQRVMIALAMSCQPALLLADEPTTGLDVTLTKEILGLFRAAADTGERGVLLISHDLASIASVCDRMVVLYAGTVVESGPADQVLSNPQHPYTAALIQSVPDVDGAPIEAIGGSMPLLRAAPDFCPFADRCARATETCRTQRPSLRDISAALTAATGTAATGTAATGTAASESAGAGAPGPATAASESAPAREVACFHPLHEPAPADATGESA